MKMNCRDYSSGRRCEIRDGASDAITVDPKLVFNRGNWIIEQKWVFPCKVEIYLPRSTTACRWTLGSGEESEACWASKETTRGGWFPPPISRVQVKFELKTCTRSDDRPKEGWPDQSLQGRKYVEFAQMTLFW
jgi:hypothetical protein